MVEVEALSGCSEHIIELKSKVNMYSSLANRKLPCSKVIRAF